MASENVAAAATAQPDRPEQPRHGKRGAPQAFARKLAEILRDEAESVISWNEAGTAFMVKDVERFSQDVLVKHYRHSKFSSFQRQLNLYQFRKIVKGPDAGGYQHPMFHRDRPEDLCHVRRSVSGSGAGAKATSKRNGAAAGAAASSKQQAKGEAAGWGPPRALKSAAAARRVGKLRNKAVVPAGSRNPSASSITMSPQQQQYQLRPPTSFAQLLMADHDDQQAATATGQQVFSGSTDIASDAGDRSPWTSGESSDSDVSISEAASSAARGSASAAASERSSTKGAVKQAKEPRSRHHRRQQGADDSSDDSEDEGAERGSSSDDSEDGRGRGEARRVHQPQHPQQQQQEQEEEGSFSSLSESAGDALSRVGEEGPQQQVAAGGGGGVGAQRAAASSTARKSPFSFFKKFSFTDKSTKSTSTSSVDAGAASGAPPPISSSSSSSNLNNSPPVSPLMVDTSAAARAAAAGLTVTARGVRPPPVTVTGGAGQHRVPMDPSTAAGNKALTSSPLTPKSSMEAAALAAAAAASASAAMPPPQARREGREELGLVEQLTNMVEVFDICDLLRKVSTSNSSRLDKHGGIVKPNGPQHLRNMSVDTDQGLPQSPVQGGGRQGQSPTGLGSLASMELVRDSSKDWDTLMAGSADVSDLGNTMVQSVAEFFSF